MIENDPYNVSIITDLRLMDFHGTRNQISPYAKKECGITSTERIIGGRNANLGDYPWQVFLRIQTSNGLKMSCGGSLISDKYVLTAAHCLTAAAVNVVKITVTVGSVEITDSNRGKSGLQIVSTGWKVHPQWENDGIDHDIGIITIPSIENQQVTWTPVCLPTKTTEDVEVPCITSGFGKTSDDEGDKSEKRLKFIRTKTLDNEECKRRSAFMSIYLKPSMICIGGEGGRETVCSGDSGGPLVKQESGRFVLIGITSFGGTELCETPAPSAFTRVKHYLEYICNDTGICQ
ncbi:unnamed protein product [Notodromas monacha]|uniref:Peptidase S1 domain-containing protein n=1 Tax=Notodromas monacha TaxID=399045 RepID=A0A7R9GJU0_9CRUS|nr:unnamed protein product [Notodromas monacha]CAG0923919.1 unnamed protein product [Notodromas monacha]